MSPSLPADDVTALAEMRRRRPDWHRFSDARRPKDIEAAYRLQQQIHAALERGGVNRVGWKIASIATEGQRALGLTEPAYAGIYDLTRKPTLREALALPFVAPSLECEIAFVMGRPLTGTSDLSDEGLRAAIASGHLACEVIDNRYGAPLDVGIPTILTDDFFHSAFVLGPPVADWETRLERDVPGFIEIDGKVVHGSTADALRPFEALRWLVGKLASHGLALAAGDIVLAGSLVQPTPVSLPAASVTIATEGFGALTLAD
ncbi:2-keto-4-pentenoate hydratase-like protein [Ancylobacter novellus DSM 506]|uniref:2-keto-4-pentenoate hydratase-like protein n=1 Tax=Ancylobacter novellus (strain ATCC 8093 / DSM 506 / JCM 20403 / CCM 1077 / IAM 12100 / NBRC 12443 / NCIMB 10456) TaxID=639283 RepID=D7A0M0_ANCN5|nr:fumarylacetoacetate hydrolase family protein [Ancylobacter novellus]ADH91341.1 2-keto-4-pentenoate hydratase-like protein [Ancylobacter novellus DSM 506]